MSVFRAAHAEADGWAQASKACVDRLGALDEGFNLGFLYVNEALAPDLSSILTFVRERTRIEDWVGAVGYGVCASGREFFGAPAMTVLVAALPSDSFHVFPPVEESLEAFHARNRDWVKRSEPVFAIVHGDSQDATVPEIVARLAEETPAFLVGGLASMAGARNVVAGKATGGGVSGVMFSSRVAVATGLSQGCTPLGPIHAITEAEGNVLVGLDERNALDVFIEDIGEELAEDLGRVPGLIHAALPVKGSDTGDYLVRNLIGIDAGKGWLAIGAPVEPGDQVMFCARDRDSAARDMARMLKNLKARAPGTPKGGVYVSCVARGPNLFGAGSEELKMIRDALGDFPLAGFYANGEISNDRLYGYTGVLTLFL